MRRLQTETPPNFGRCLVSQTIRRPAMPPPPSSQRAWIVCRVVRCQKCFIAAPVNRSAVWSHIVAAAGFTAGITLDILPRSIALAEGRSACRLSSRAAPGFRLLRLETTALLISIQIGAKNALGLWTDVNDANELVDGIRRMFKWGAIEQLVPASVPQSLSMVAGLLHAASSNAERPEIVAEPV